MQPPRLRGHLGYLGSLPSPGRKRRRGRAGGTVCFGGGREDASSRRSRSGGLLGATQTSVPSLGRAGGPAQQHRAGLTSPGAAFPSCEEARDGPGRAELQSALSRLACRGIPRGSAAGPAEEGFAEGPAAVKSGTCKGETGALCKIFPGQQRGLQRSLSFHWLNRARVRSRFQTCEWKSTGCGSS